MFISALKRTKVYSQTGWGLGWICSLLDPPVFLFKPLQCSLIVGRGGALVESIPFDRRVVGWNPALAATLGPSASPSLAVAYSAPACKFRHKVNCCGRELF